MLAKDRRRLTSQSVCLPPLNGALFAWSSGPPLSELNPTTMFSIIPLPLSAATTRPTCVSIVSIIAAVTLYVSSWMCGKRRTLASGAWCGSCSLWKAR